MNRFAARLWEQTPGGVLRWPSPLPMVECVALAAGAGWTPLRLGPEAVGRTAFLSRVGELFGFPATYGQNFDALADLLRDVGAAPGERGTVLLWEGWDAWAAQDPRTFAIALDVLAERAEEPALPPLLVLLTGTGASESVAALGVL